MTWARRFWLRLQTLFRRNRSAQQLNDEIQFHLVQQIVENVAAGMSPQEARHAATRTFGNPTFLKEETRDTWGWTWLEQLGQDLRYATRTLRKSLGFTLVAVLTLALGIGANTAIFSVIDAVLLRPLPYAQSDRLMMVYEAEPRLGRGGLSYPNFQDWKRAARSFEELIAMRTSQFALSGSGEAIYVICGAVTSGCFPMFRVVPVLGRTFEPRDDVPQATAVVVLSEGLWRSRFGSDPTIVGKTIQLEQRPFTVIGVVPGNFRSGIRSFTLADRRRRAFET